MKNYGITLIGGNYVTSGRQICFRRKKIEMKTYGGCGDSFLVSHEAVSEMTSGRQIQTHDSIVRIQKTGVHRKVGWGTAVRLNLVDHKNCIVK